MQLFVEIRLKDGGSLSENRQTARAWADRVARQTNLSMLPAQITLDDPPDRCVGEVAEIERRHTFSQT
jgi:hypothetical protein